MLDRITDIINAVVMAFCGVVILLYTIVELIAIFIKKGGK